MKVATPDIDSRRARLVLTLGLLAISLALTPALAQDRRETTGSATARGDRSVTVELKNAQGQPVGTVMVRQLAHGVVFVADLTNLPPGPHGFHVHERGACDAPDFQSAGGHYNPTNAEHGFDTPRGHHVGDLPNVHVTQQGTAKAEFHSARLKLRGESGQPGNAGPFPLLDDDGSAIVIHAQGDDYEATPPDSTGARIACGIISR